MTTSKVTIGIPTYNRAAYLREAIHSALGQSYANLEIIVSDNASTDDTRVVLSTMSDKRISIVTHAENGGMVYNWNSCLSRATGEFFLLLSDDDILDPDAIVHLLSGFSSDSITLSYGQVTNIQESGDKTDTFLFKASKIESGRQFFANVIAGKTGAFPSATMFRVADGRALGGYPNIGTAADLGLHMQLAMQGSVAFNPASVALYRVHASAESFSRRAISSQLRLVDWISKTDTSLAIYRGQIIQYCNNMVYGWGRYHALNCQKSEVNYADYVLQKICPNSPRRLLLRFYTFSVIRWSINLARSIKRLIKACISTVVVFY
jgi:glycosyltransferase involved in cell wall biosynthesis